MTDALHDHAIGAAHKRYNAVLAPRDTAYSPSDAMHEAVEAALFVYAAALEAARARIAELEEDPELEQAIAAEQDEYGDGENACTHCGGEGYCDDGADPLGNCPDEAHNCHACGGSGARKDQRIF